MVARIPITHGLVALVDDTDYTAAVAAGPWYATLSGYTAYAQRNIPASDKTHRRSSEQLHRFLTGWVLVDHRNGDGLDNRRDNLRPATAALNAINKRVSKNSETGFKGVTLNKKTGRWYARISLNGRTKHLGAFATAEAAALRHDEIARDTYGAFACLNFPRNGERGARADVLDGRT